MKRKAIAIINRNHVLIRLSPSPRRMEFSEATGSFAAIEFAVCNRCEGCRSKNACRDWLDYAPAMVNFAPCFCPNADNLFELQYDQPGPRRVDRWACLRHHCLSAAFALLQSRGSGFMRFQSEVLRTFYLGNALEATNFRLSAGLEMH
jgi:hypothetical protein